MKYKSGNIYLTTAGAFMFVGPETDIKLVTLFRKEESRGLHPVSNIKHTESLAWVREHGDRVPVINITDHFKEKWYE